MGDAEHEVDRVREPFDNGGSARMTFSMPLLGESKPKVRMTRRPSTEQILVEIGVDERHVGNAVVNKVDFCGRHSVDLAQVPA